MSLLELRSEKDLEVAKTCFANGEPFGKVCDRLGVKLGRELNMTDDAWRFTPTSEILPDGKDPRNPEVAKQLLEMGYLVLHEGKTFHQYTDRWEERSRYLVSLLKLQDKQEILKLVKFYRIGIREVSSSTNERTLIAALLSYGTTSGHTVTHEKLAAERSIAIACATISFLNSYSVDWVIRLSAASHVTKFLLNMIPVPSFSHAFLSHSALRLTCNHTGYEPLWREQLSEIWRESQSPFTFPVLPSEDDRWLVRAAIDAVVADAYGLNREQYAHILSTFSHKSYPKAPQLCLACFDELQTIGLETFTKKYDPYWDIPLNENLPKPVIDLPIPNQSNENVVSTDDGSFQLTPPPEGKPKRRKKK
ncbi:MULTISPECIES: hypothetical protein [Nostocales]|uniref:Uncharacterized protein n=3 Tax=Nostocales TaxID=1161 RepID=A0A0C1N2Q6_9CYAN|nr:hypothetical protein [Tolypothrix bouteillei]